MPEKLAFVNTTKQNGVCGDNIPDMLKRGRFCLWKSVQRIPESKPAKVPYNPKTDDPLDVTRPEEFGTFDEAYAKYQAGGYDGIGIRVDEPIVGIDIDHCIDDDGNLSAMAQEIVEAMGNSYTEVSPSGKGIRIFCFCPQQFCYYDKGTYLMKNGKLGLEIYVGGQTARYVTVTGHAILPGAEVGVRDSELRQVLDTYMLRQTAAAGSSQQKSYSQSGQAPKDLTQADEELIERIANSDSGEQFSALMDGDMSSCNGDHSSADMALTNILAVRTGDGEQIDRIFRSSKLMRSKWDEMHGASTYGEMTINKALADTAQYRSTQLPVNISPAQIAALQRTPTAVSTNSVVSTNPLLRKPKPPTAVPATEEAAEEKPTAVIDNPLLRKPKPPAAVPAAEEAVEEEPGAKQEEPAQPAPSGSAIITNPLLRKPKPPVADPIAKEVAEEKPAAVIDNPLLRKPKPPAADPTTEKVAEEEPGAKQEEPEEDEPFYEPEEPADGPEELTTHGYVAQPTGSQPPVDCGYVIEDLRDLMDTLITLPEYVVENILPVGLAILAAPPKVGKSWMALYLAICLTLGRAFLGYQVQQCGVLYLALEDSRSRLKTRSQKLLGCQQLPYGLKVATIAPSLQDKPGLIEYLDSYLTEEPDTKLIIIDTLQKVRGVSGNKETLYGHDYREVGKLKKFADEHNICLLLIHHTRKMKDEDPFNRISGTNGIMGAADTAWLIERGEKKNGKTTACLRITGRDVVADDLKLEFNAQTCIWESLGRAEDCEEKEQAEAYENDELVRTIRELLDKSPDGTWEGLATDILRAGQPKGWLADFTAQKVANRLAVLEPLLMQNDRIQHTPVSTNGNGGKKHRFSIIKHDDDGTQNAQALPSIIPEQLDAVKRVASAAGAVSVTNNPLLRNRTPPGEAVS